MLKKISNFRFDEIDLTKEPINAAPENGKMFEKFSSKSVSKFIKSKNSNLDVDLNLILSEVFNNYNHCKDTNIKIMFSDFSCFGITNDTKFDVPKFNKIIDLIEHRLSGNPPVYLLVYLTGQTEKNHEMRGFKIWIEKKISEESEDDEDAELGVINRSLWRAVPDKSVKKEILSDSKNESQDNLENDTKIIEKLEISNQEENIIETFEDGITSDLDPNYLKLNNQLIYGEEEEDNDKVEEEGEDINSDSDKAEDNDNDNDNDNDKEGLPSKNITQPTNVPTKIINSNEYKPLLSMMTICMLTAALILIVWLFASFHHAKMKRDEELASL